MSPCDLEYLGVEGYLVQSTPACSTRGMCSAGTVLRRQDCEVFLCTSPPWRPPGGSKSTRTPEAARWRRAGVIAVGPGLRAQSWSSVRGTSETKPASPYHLAPTVWVCTVMCRDLGASRMVKQYYRYFSPPLSHPPLKEIEKKKKKKKPKAVGNGGAIQALAVRKRRNQSPRGLNTMS